MALREHWKNLIGITAFPIVFFVTANRGIPHWVLIALFLSVCIHAAWPWLRHRAPYSFWVVAGGFYMLGALLGVGAVALLESAT